MVLSHGGYVDAMVFLMNDRQSSEDQQQSAPESNAPQYEVEESKHEQEEGSSSSVEAVDGSEDGKEVEVDGEERYEDPTNMAVADPSQMASGPSEAEDEQIDLGYATSLHQDPQYLQVMS